MADQTTQAVIDEKARIAAAQKRAQAIAAKAVANKEARKTALFAKADALVKANKDVIGSGLILPFTDRDGSIVPALVLGMEDVPARDANGPLQDDQNQPIFEARFIVWIFSKIDVPRRGTYVFPAADKKGA